MIKQQETPSPVITPETQSRIFECTERGCWESLWNVKKRNSDTDSVSLVLFLWSHFENLPMAKLHKHIPDAFQ